MKNKVVLYILIWILPVTSLGICMYNAVLSAWIFFFGEGKWERLNGFAYLMMAVCHVPALLITTIAAVVITIHIQNKNIMTKRQ